MDIDRKILSRSMRAQALVELAIGMFACPGFLPSFTSLRLPAASNGRFVHAPGRGH